MRRKYHFYGYTLTFDALIKMVTGKVRKARTGQTVPTVDDIGPYIAQMKERLNTSANTLEESFDSLFPIVQVVRIEKKSRDVYAVVFVRAAFGPGDDSHPGWLLETPEDERVKKAVEECLGVKTRIRGTGPITLMIEL